MDIPSIVSTAVGCVPLPGLKVAFDTFRWIWSSVVQVQSNKAQLIQLASAIAELLTTLQGNLRASLTPEQGASLKRLQTLLDEISSFVSGLQQMHFLKALFRKDEVSASITAYHERIYHACDAFNISSQINLQVWLAQSESTKRADYASLELLLQKLNFDQVAMLDLLNISDTKQDTLLTMMIALQQAVTRISNNTERMFMQQAVRVIQRYSTSTQDVNDLPTWLVTSWEVDIERKKIGAGGFGKVYPAKWHGTKVAIKELDSQTSPELLKQEVDIWSKLLHPHVLQFLGAAIYETTPFLVMPLMINGNCLDYIKKNPSADRGLLIHQITLGLAYLHSRRPPILHGDLKAVNVLVNASGDAILADFGLSRVNRDISTRSSRVHTAGSLRWMAPERLRSGKLTTETDVYAFALTVYEIYTEAIPFGDIDDSMLYTLVVKEDERPRQHDEDAIPPYSIDDRVWVILTRAWDPNPRQRPSAVQLVDMTAPLVSESSRPTKSLSPPPPAESVPLSPRQPAEARDEATETQKLPTWVELASSPDVRAQLQACEGLIRDLRETPTMHLLTEVLEQLIRLLMSSDLKVSHSAASVLGLYTHVPIYEWFTRDRYQKGVYTENHARDCIAGGALLPFSAILQRSHDKQNLATACYVVGNLGFFPSSGDALLRAKVIPLIVRLLKHSDSEVQAAAIQTIGKISANNGNYRAECIVAGALSSLYALLASSDLDRVQDVCVELPHLFDGFHVDIKKAGFHTRVMTLLNHERPKLCIAATFCLVNIILYGGTPHEEPNEYVKATMRLCLKNNLLPRLLSQLSYPDRQVILYTCLGVLDLTYGFADKFIEAKIHERMVKLASDDDYDIQNAAQLSLIRFCSQSSWLSKRRLKKAGTIDVLKNLAVRDVYAQVAIHSLSSILL